MTRLARLAAIFFVACAVPAAAQAPRGVVVDQTGLPLPGVTVQLVAGEEVVLTLVSEADGTFALPADARGDLVVAALQGFETSRVPRADAARIVLSIARTTETTTVVAPIAAAATPTGSLLGTTMTASTVARLPSSRMRAKESLPLLPSVFRGPDGLMQVGGARAHDAPLLLDGFNVTDPSTGTSSINLPYEAVRGVDVLRDPMAVTYGGLLAGVVKMESNPGGDRRRIGVQGVLPRPRFTSPGFGRLEGIFPRFYISGTAGDPRLHYIAAIEYDYERIPVPDVTEGKGPDLVEESATVFTRLDADLSDRHRLTFEGLAFPSRTRDFGLSPRRDESATTDLSATDLFAGFTDRFVVNSTTVFTIQIGALAHDTTIAPKGQGASLLTPDGWRGNWFAAASRTAVRYTAAATWERLKTIRGRVHDFTLSGELAARRLRGRVAESPIVVSNAGGETVRTVHFGSDAQIGAHDRPVALALRDTWTVNNRTQLDGGVRVDHSGHGGGRPSGRVGVRYALDDNSVTVLKAGYGSFVGSMPLAIPAFGAYPMRTDRWFEPGSGDLVAETMMRPTVGRLRLPQSLAATVALERQLGERLDAQIVLTDRRSSRLATLQVPVESGALEVSSNGSGQYREVQLSVRRTWEKDQQLFVSYVRSEARGELNDFATLFQAIATPLVQPGGMSRLASDARHRVIAWGTFNLPRRTVVSPVTEWRSGFLYSPVNERYLYAGTPNSRSFPSFLATDMVIYKTFTARGRSADVGMQLFNLTNHRNPRDVYSVVGPRFGQFANSVGTIVRGYILMKW